MKRRLVLLLVLATPTVLTASCADSEDAAGPAEPPPTHIFEEAAAPEADAGIDAPVMDASANAFRIVPTNVSPFFVLKAIWGTATNDIWAAGSGGAIAHYDGSAWAVVPSGVKNTFNAIWGSGPDDVYLVADVDAVFHTDKTAKLTALPLDTSGAKVNAVWGTSAENVRLGTDYVFFYDQKGNSQSGVQFSRAPAVDAGDAGAPSWKAVALDVNGDQFGTTVRSIWGASPNDLWISASQLDTPRREGITYHGLPEDGGVAFREVDSQSSNTLESIHGTSANDVWAVGSGGAIRHFSSAAARWQVVASPTKETLHGVFAIAPNDVWAVGDHGTIVHYDGSAFSLVSAEMPADRTPALYGIWASGPDDVWVVGDAIALHHGTTP